MEKAVKEISPEDKYKCEADARTLLDAAEILGDSKRYAGAKGELEKKKKAISTLADLGKLREEIKEDKDEGEEDADA